MTDRLAKRVLLIGWDAADWKMIEPLLEAGQMPNLRRLTEQGVMGNVASLNPMLSPILWTSIATGKHGDKHGILGFAEPDGDSGRLRPVTSTSRKCKALWNILSERGLRSGVLNWFASHPAEPVNGFIVTDRFPHSVAELDKPWPSVPDSVHPAESLDDVCKLRIHPAQTTAVQIAPFIPKLTEFDAVKDKKVQELRVLLAQCGTTHAAATWLMQTQEWDFLGIYYDAIDRVAHAFMEYHPPKAEHLSDEEFERFKDVMTGCYRFHDMMLGRLMELAGEDATIIVLSDHGFHCDHLRPTGSSKIEEGNPVAWHRRYGMLVVSGPNVKKDQRVYGASLLDVTPTILAMLGCPVAKDMDGKPLLQIFDPPPNELPEIDTYETPDEQPAADSAGESDAALEAQMLERLADLGYIDNNSSSEGIAADRARNLAQIYASTNRPKLAIEQYEQLLLLKPDDKAAKIAIAGCRLQTGELEAAEKLVGDVLVDKSDAPLANFYMGVLCFRRGDPAAALNYLQQAAAVNPDWIDLQCQIGAVFLRRKRWLKAEAAFDKALEIDPDCADAHDGLGAAYRGQGRPEEAVQEHMQSIALLHYRPQTHVNLGLALAESGQFDWAIRAFGVAIEQDERNPFPHRCLAHLYRTARPDADKAARHREEALRLIAERRGTRAEAADAGPDDPGESP